MCLKLSDFESGLQRLETILEKMGDAGTTLEESIGLYAEAAKLIAESNERLAMAQVRIDEIDAELKEVPPG